MSALAFLMPDRAVVIKNGPVGTDRLGRPVLGEVARSAEMPARFEQLQSTETGEFIAGRWRGYLPAGTAVTAEDRIACGSRVFAVAGAPLQQRLPGVPLFAHVALDLTLVEG